MADYLKLFHAKRLTAAEPHHLEFIKGRLAAMKVEDHKAYLEFSAYYGVEVEATVTREPKTVAVEDTATGTVEVPVKVKKPGRPSKSSTL